jgi:uncharacterized membrane protein affecting hemolysin expression
MDAITAKNVRRQISLEMLATGSEAAQKLVKVITHQNGVKEAYDVY